MAHDPHIHSMTRRSKHKKVRKYAFKRDEDLGDAELDSKMMHRTEGIRMGRRQVAGKKHRISTHGRNRRRGSGGRRI
jgi:hypothetical protein